LLCRQPLVDGVSLQLRIERFLEIRDVPVRSPICRSGYEM
jgi:hypothetical protein